MRAVTRGRAVKRGRQDGVLSCQPSVDINLDNPIRSCQDGIHLSQTCGHAQDQLKAAGHNHASGPAAPTPCAKIPAPAQPPSRGPPSLREPLPCCVKKRMPYMTIAADSLHTLHK